MMGSGIAFGNDLVAGIAVPQTVSPNSATFAEG